MSKKSSKPPYKIVEAKDFFLPTGAIFTRPSEEMDLVTIKITAADGVLRIQASTLKSIGDLLAH